MVVSNMSKLVINDSDYFIVSLLFNQSIEDDNLPEETESHHEGVRMA